MGMCRSVCVCVWEHELQKLVGILLLFCYIFPVLSLFGDRYCTYWNRSKSLNRKDFCMYPMWLGKNPCFSLLGLKNVHLEHAKMSSPSWCLSPVRGRRRGWKWAFSVNKCQQWAPYAVVSYEVWQFATTLGVSASAVPHRIGASLCVTCWHPSELFCESSGP